LAAVVSTLRPSRILGPVYASTTLSMVAFSLVSVALPFRFEALGLSVVQYGTVVAVFALGMLTLESVWGALSYRLASRGAMLGLGVGVAAIFVAVALSHSFATFALTFGVLGAMMIFPVPLMRWIALTSGGPGTGGTGTGRYAVFFGVGLVIGSSLGPLLYVAIGFLSLSVLAVVLWMGSIGLLMIVPWPLLNVARRTASVVRQVRRVFTPYFGSVALLVTLYFTSYSLTAQFLQYYSVDLFGGSAVASGYVIGATRGTTLVAGFLLGSVVDRWGPSRSPPFGFLLLVAGALGTFFSHSYAEMVAATLVFATGAGWLSAGLLPLALAPVSHDLQGTAVGVFGSFEDFGLLVGPVLIGSVYSAYGPASIFLFVAGVATAGAVAATVLASVARWHAPTGGDLSPGSGRAPQRSPPVG
jgi:MFS family permease